MFKTLHILFVILVILSSFAFGQPYGHEGGEYVSEEGRFIFPNELEMTRFRPAVAGVKGVAIGVGTFRMVQLAAMGDFDEVIFFDQDTKVVDFNYRHFSLLRHARGHVAYLDSLFAVSAADTYNGEAPLLDPVTAKFTRDSFAEASHLEREFTQFLYFTNSEAFIKVQRMARAGRFRAILGNLIGDKVLRNISSELDAQSQKVSIFDISNAHEYLFTGSDWWRFINNIKDIPWAPDAKILMTASIRYLHVIKSYQNPTPQMRETMYQLRREMGYNSSGFIYVWTTPAELIAFGEEAIRAPSIKETTGTRLLTAINDGVFRLLGAQYTRRKPMSPSPLCENLLKRSDSI